MNTETRAQLDKLDRGDPPAPDAGLFGASIPVEDAKLVVIPVPWEATTSYGQGTADGPSAILQASHQLDLVDLAFGKPYWAGIALAPADVEIARLGILARPMAERVIHALEAGKPVPDSDLEGVNSASDVVNMRVYESSSRMLAQGKAVAILGGDHSAPLGLIKALGERYSEHGFGILHIDAHHDLREAYEGFRYSHASIMYNVLEEVSAVTKLVSLGIRDFSASERAYALANEARVNTFYDAEVFARRAHGATFGQIVTDILSGLPERVYISFDIDGLEPAFCPSTGTPVPGGLAYQEAIFLIEQLALSGRKVIGFDLCEVAPSKDGSEWDANVGARILYKLCGALVHSSGLID